MKIYRTPKGDVWQAKGLRSLEPRRKLLLERPCFGHHLVAVIYWELEL